MALSADRLGRQSGHIIHYDRPLVAANAVIFLGALVSYDANGYLAANADTAAQANKSIGLALEHCDNTGGADGAVRALIAIEGMVALAAGPLVQADIGKDVHATDDNTLALTSTNGRIVGKLVGIDGATALVRMGA